MNLLPANLKLLTPIQAVAVGCVVVNSIIFAYFGQELITILASPGWCGKALQADRIIPGSNFQGLTACVDLLKMQVGALAKTLLIVIGTFALCLGVLVVIVLAGARLVGTLLGNNIDLTRQDPPNV